MTSPSGARVPEIDLHALATELFPINRSLTGDGVRETLAVVARHVGLDIHEVPTGTPVLDWHVPSEWNIRRASIATMSGRRLVDFADNNLHVMGYSKPVQAVLSRAELARHVHTLPDQPDLIPYRTGYYADDWGFCLPDRLWQEMTDDSYRVDIDSELSHGALTYGELFVPGRTNKEVLITCHICHPSLANDNLSGISIATALAMRQARQTRRLGYRFLFLPATIGALAWLDRNESRVDRVEHGLVLTCLGDSSGFHYKQSRKGAPIDRAVMHVLKHSGHRHESLPFSPYGYDERQFCSPGFDLPVGCLMRGVHGTFPEYHTSADNLDFIKPECLDESYAVIEQVLDLLDGDLLYERLDGRGEPQLGRRGLYRAIAGQREAGGATQMDLLWVLNLADGKHSLLDMAIRADVPFARIEAAAGLALEAGLIRPGAPSL
ncbi:aminopeptidase [Bradyrhizobium sp. SSBR45G]|nr:aminopeptidase [Bradyrhizobium sp. SSBR45G]GLH87323.1 aminopeptidase [Bradyrhizobium sp. SSBR45R]